MTEHVQAVTYLEQTEAPRQPGLAAPGRFRVALGWLAGRALPNLLIVIALGGLAWWGHHSGWKLPAFAELDGRAGEHKDDWCDEHAIPESLCVECNPDLLPRGKAYGWCKVHGVHECPLEHPDVAQLQNPPRVTRGDLDRARRALQFAVRPANSSKCKLHQRRIQFASDEAVARAGVEVAEAWQQPVMIESIKANGEITYDQGRVANLSAPVAGKVWRIFKGLGERVTKGEVVALVDAAEVGKAKAEFLRALAQVDLRAKVVAQLKPLAGGPVSGAQLQEAEAALYEARIRLVAAQQALGNLGLPVQAKHLQGLTAEEAGRRMQFLGLSDEIVRGLGAGTTTTNLIPIKSPLNGVVVARKAVAGEQADAARPLLVVADTSRMWLVLQVRQEDARLIRARDPVRGTPGHPVRFRPVGFDHDVNGEVVWVSTAADEKTRTIQVRADLANPDGQLRANTFGSGRILLRQEKGAIVVPSDAVQWEGDCFVVFVRDKNYEAAGAPKVFHTRTVRPGAREGDVTEIIAGVLPGELVVARGSGVLRSELLKNSLGEG